MCNFADSRSNANPEFKHDNQYAGTDYSTICLTGIAYHCNEQ